MSYSVAKDIHPFVGNDPEVDFILFFTDNKNEPRKINVRRCIEGDEAFTGNALGYIGEDMQDFINACPKTPMVSIQFDFQLDPDIGSNNFISTDGLQFAYQNVYIDGFVSALSSYSEVAYPDSIEALGAQSMSEIEPENMCNLNIPRGSKEVSRVRILFREGDGGAWKIIDEVSAKIEQGNSNFFFLGSNENAAIGEPLGYYSFYNDKVYPIVPKDTSDKNFDNLPQKAEGQAIANNRLMYANYIDGFDPVICRSIGTVIFEERPTDLINATLNIGTTFVHNEEANEDLPISGASVAFKINTFGLPNTIPSGIYDLSLNFRAKKNIHLYNSGGTDEYYGSTNLEKNRLLGFYPDENFNAQADFDSKGLKNGPSGTLSYRGSFTNGSLPRIGDGQWQSIENDQIGIAVGTSPANPLIIPFSNSSVNIILQVDGDAITNANFAVAIRDILTTGSADGVTVISATGVELPNEDPVRLTHNIQTGLNSGDVVKQKERNSQLVSAVVSTDSGERNAPLGFFIVKSGSVSFKFEGIDDSSGALYDGETEPQNPQASGVRYVRMVLDDISIMPEDTLTCFPRPVKGRGKVWVENDIAQTSSEDSLWTIGVINQNSWVHAAWPGVSNINVNEISANTFRGKDGTNVPIDAYTSYGKHILQPHGGGNKVEAQAAISTPIAIDEWVLLDGESVLENEALQHYALDLNAPSNIISAAQNLWGATESPISFPYKPAGAVKNIISDYGGGGSPSGDNFSADWEGYFHSLSFDFDAAKARGFSITDGAAGPGGAGIDGGADDIIFHIEGGGENPYKVINQGDGQAAENHSGRVVPTGNKYGSVWSSNLVGIVNNLPYLDLTGQYINSDDTMPAYSVYDWNGSSPTTDRIVGDDDKSASKLEKLPSLLQLGTTGLGAGSFKTRDTHDFGMVYYDKRGRASSVFPLDSVYVPGYSDAERNQPGATKGPVSIKQRLVHPAPSWADRYKIVYSPTSNISRFIQYSSGGAFINENHMGL